MRKRTLCQCDYCGKKYYVVNSRAKKSKHQFCSRSCYDLWAFKKHSEIHKCAECGLPFKVISSNVSLGYGKFCSQKCYDTHRKKMSIISIKTRTCKQCGVKFEVKGSKLKQAACDFCSRDCYYEYFVGEHTPGWKGGISFEPYCVLFNNAFKERVRAFFGNKCALCGKSPEENGRALCIHHVGYDKEACCNDSERLFVPLCNSCHGKTNIRRDYWQDYFTKLIHENYNGKCYYTKEEYNAINP